MRKKLCTYVYRQHLSRCYYINIKYLLLVGVCSLGGVTTMGGRWGGEDY